MNEARELELRDVWLSRLMFGWIIDGTHGTDRYTETRSFEEFLADHETSDSSSGSHARLTRGTE